MKKDCKTMKGKEGDTQQENNHEINMKGDVLQDSLIVSLENIIGAWVAYARASFHEKPNRKHFHDYVQGYFGVDLLGNDKSIKSLECIKVS